ncbi:hypothetical protein LOAG_04353 [Loa loa]|uniref:Uncharacterized protein n=1 Tax=Loa loa TaxID=7209 RepID=A0A1S0U220_LOALO|nr:hypothetical protein LOAG_04353 [Loa loa]EFO24134.1 hypothetical protein LOAG_04353 [Loa loa]
MSGKCGQQKKDNLLTTAFSEQSSVKQSTKRQYFRNIFILFISIPDLNTIIWDSGISSMNFNERNEFDENPGYCYQPQHLIYSELILKSPTHFSFDIARFIFLLAVPDGVSDSDSISFRFEADID